MLPNWLKKLKKIEIEEEDQEDGKNDEQAQQSDDEFAGNNRGAKRLKHATKRSEGYICMR